MLSITQRLLSNLNTRTPWWMKFGRGTLYLRTTRGTRTLDRIASIPGWTLWHTLGLISTILTMVTTVGYFTFAAVMTLTATPEPTAANDPQNMLLIPGVNDFIPPSATIPVILALFVAATLHEFGHAIAAYDEDLEVTEMGLILFFGLPLGAYVKPTEELHSAPTGAFTRVMAAGIMNNVALTVVGYGLLAASSATMETAYLAYFGPLLGVTTDATLSQFAAFGFWLFFINLNLVLVNALPIPGLDGGHIFKRFAQEIGLRLGIDHAKARFHKLATGVGVSVLTILVILLFGPHVL